MCGICGILANKEEFDGSQSHIVKAMKTLLKHRGPDAEGSHASPYGILGHQRLSIIDINGGDQPMVSLDGRYVLVYNGEIYNYLELRQNLIQLGHVFRTFSDTEVLLQLLMAHGESALNKLIGMFAFVFLDTHTGSWLLARDQFGIKPLYYAHTKTNQFVFASEIKALLEHPDILANVNMKGLGHYFTFQFCLGEETLFKHIYKVEPGYYLKGQGGVIKEKTRYWDADFTVDEHHTDQYFSDRLRTLLQDSARLQIRSDVPLGAYLSGGLDSSAITCFAADLLEAGMPVFTGKFAESLEYDESEFANIVAKVTGAATHEIVPTALDFVTHMPKIIEALDEPVAGPGVFPQYMVSRVAVNHVKVILGGQGGDEIFGGYARYLVGYLEQALKGAIYETQEEGKHLVDLESIVPNLPLLKNYAPLMKNFWQRGLFEDMDARYFRLIDRSPDIASLLTTDVINSIDRKQIFNDFRKTFNHPNTRSYINKMTHFDFKTLLPALLQVEDRMSMAVSLESRVPILDTRIMNLVASAPPSMKFKGGKTKALLKSAVKNIVPDAIINRKDKMGFPVPLREWAQNGVVKEFVNDVLMSQKSRERGIYGKKALAELGSNQGVGSRQLWGALCLELWHQRYIDNSKNGAL
jgi:asparagine synthase (glutamine-hydrolysing)